MMKRFEGGRYRQAGGTGKQLGELGVALAIDRAVTGDGLRPAAANFSQRSARPHRASCRVSPMSTQLGQQGGVEAPLVAGVAGIDQHATGAKRGREVLDDGPDEFAVFAGAEGDGCFPGAISTGMQFCSRSMAYLATSVSRSAR